MYTKNLPYDLIDSGPCSADENMSLDTKLLAELNPLGKPILHLYDWTHPSATFGHFIAPEKHLDLSAVAKRGLSLARRPTGGGIVFHIWDLAFSFLMPSGHPLFSQNTLDNYRFVNQIVLESVTELFHLEDKPILTLEHAPEKGSSCTHFCMARPTIYDVVYKEMKIAGAAQRRTRLGYLHQGTISLVAPDYDLLKEVLHSKEEIVQAMSFYTFAPLTQKSLGELRKSLQELLKQKFLAKIGPHSL